MPFSIGLDLPGEAFHDWLNPHDPFATALPAIGKFLGGSLDLALGLPNDELRGHYESQYRAKQKYASEDSDLVNVSAYGISETPVPATQDAPTRLFHNPALDQADTAPFPDFATWQKEKEAKGECPT